MSIDELGGQSRRDFIRKAAITGAFVVPAVTSFGMKVSGASSRSGSMGVGASNLPVGGSNSDPGATDPSAGGGSNLGPGAGGSNVTTTTTIASNVTTTTVASNVTTTTVAATTTTVAEDVTTEETDGDTVLAAETLPESK